MADDKLYSDYLSGEAVLAAMESLPRVLHDLLGECLITAYYGICCNLHNDLLYQPMRISTTWLDRFIAESIAHRIVVPGSSDLSCEVPDGRLSVLFCHESDIHVGGSDDKRKRRQIDSAIRVVPPFASIGFQPREPRQV